MVGSHQNVLSRRQRTRILDMSVDADGSEALAPIMLIFDLADVADFFAEVEQRVDARKRIIL